MACACWRRRHSPRGAAGSFASVQACEQSRQETIRFLTLEDQNPTFSRKGDMLDRDRALLTKCVKADDPRLK